MLDNIDDTGVVGHTIEHARVMQGQKRSRGTGDSET